MARQKRKAISTAIEFDLEGDLAARTPVDATETAAAPADAAEQEKAPAADVVTPPITGEEAPTQKRTRKPRAAANADAVTPPITGEEAPTQKRTRKPRAVANADAVTPPVTGEEAPTQKRTRKPRAAADADAVTPPVTGEEAPTQKRTRKPRAAADADAVTPPVTGEEAPTQKRTRKPRAAAADADAVTPPVTGEETPTQKRTRKKKTDADTPVAVPPTDGEKDTQAPPPPVSLPVVHEQPRQVSPTVEVPIDFPEKEKAALWHRVVALLVLSAVIFASVLIFRFRPMSYAEKNHSIQFFYNDAESLTVIAVNGVKRGEVSGAVSASSFDESGEVAAALIGGTLYAVKGRDVINVASEVSDFTLSAKGDAVAYRTAEQLYYSKVGKKEPPVRVTGAAKSAAYCLSPDGKHLFFTYDKNESRHVDIYPSSEKNPYLAETADLVPIGIADNCRYLYYTDVDGKLYVVKGKSGERVLCADQPQLDTVIFNRDLSEVMLQNGGTTILFADAERVILPEVSNGQSLTLIANQRVTVRKLRTGTQYMMRSLLENYYFQTRGTGIMLAFLNSKGKLSDVSFVEDTSAVTVTDKSVFFLQNEKQGEAEIRTHLYHCKNGKTEKQPLFWDVSTYTANVDGSRILYTNQHGTLFSCRIGSTSVHLADSIVEGSIRVTVDDTFYYYRAEGELWASDNGDEPHMIRSGVKDFLVDAHTAYYLASCDESGVGTIFTNHRNQRKDSEFDKGFFSIR